MRHWLALAALMMLTRSAQATHLSGFYAIPLTFYDHRPQRLCVKLVSGGAKGIYQDQGSALMLIDSDAQNRYLYLGQYQLFQHHLSVVLGNYGQTASHRYSMTADIEKKQWTNGLVAFFVTGKNSEGTANGTFTATRVEGGCK